MPIYTFRNTQTGEEKDYTLRISELDQFKSDNPHLTQIITPKGMISSHNIKPDSGFRDVLKSIKKANRGSNINTW